MTARGARTTARWAGDILITLGVVVALLLVYQLWWTNVQAANAAASTRADLVAAWESTATPAPSATSEPSASAAPEASTATVEPVAPQSVTAPAVGKPFALMYIPRLRDSVWGSPVVEGVGLDELAKGVGHYPGTAMPGQIGNFATAAHRATHGELFKDFDRLKKGDRVVVETKYGWYVYELDVDKIIAPTDTWVIDPVPGQPDAEPTEALITLTTCNPRWASTERWAWWGYLVEERTRDQGPPAELASKGG
jgi:sortase A